MGQTGVGLYGANGHQVSEDRIRQAGGRLVGVCGIQGGLYREQVKVYRDLDELLEDPGIGLVCVCSPKRNDQAEDIRKIIRRGKHVYAEKPCVMREEDLDEILALARERRVILCEMADSMFEGPYNRAREIAQKGMLGEIVQVFVQKSYPYADFRPQDEDVDGGLLLQSAVYGARFAEHIAGERICRIAGAAETSLGNPAEGNLRMAATLQMILENGGIATVIANYLNQPGVGIWGNEELRIFGTKGFLKTNMEDASVDVYVGEEHLHVASHAQEGLFERLIKYLNGGEPFPYDADYLTHPTRMVLRAKKEAEYVRR